jgi:hypothetical protein
VLDSDTGIKILGAAVAGKNIVEKLLGPTAEYLGDGLKGWTERRVNNVARIFDNASNKVGDAINSPGQVHPKVLKEILESGSFAEDALAAEYFGGVLASARVGLPRDDRGAVFAKQIDRLSAYQLRAHYLFYATFKDLYTGIKGINVTVEKEIRRLMTFFPKDEFFKAMDFTDEEPVAAILNHVISGLANEGLIGTFFAFGDGPYLKSRFKAFDFEETGGFLAVPTSLGMDLFMWASGMGNYQTHLFLHPAFRLETEIDLPEIANAASVRGLNRKAPEDPDSVSWQASAENG